MALHPAELAHQLPGGDPGQVLEADLGIVEVVGLGTAVGVGPGIVEAVAPEIAEWVRPRIVEVVVDPGIAVWVGVVLEIAEEAALGTVEAGLDPEIVAAADTAVG